jgi:hypothetical protein
MKNHIAFFTSLVRGMEAARMRGSELSGRGVPLLAADVAGRSDVRVTDFQD